MLLKFSKMKLLLKHLLKIMILFHNNNVLINEGSLQGC